MNTHIYFSFIFSQKWYFANWKAYLLFNLTMYKSMVKCLPHFYDYTVSPPYLQVSYPWLQPTADQKYQEKSKNSQASKPKFSEHRALHWIHMDGVIWETTLQDSSPLRPSVSPALTVWSSFISPVYCAVRHRWMGLVKHVWAFFLSLFPKKCNLTKYLHSIYILLGTIMI
jgi:hypothetical protein